MKSLNKHRLRGVYDDGKQKFEYCLSTSPCTKKLKRQFFGRFVYTFVFITHTHTLIQYFCFLFKPFTYSKQNDISLSSNFFGCHCLASAHRWLIFWLMLSDRHGKETNYIQSIVHHSSRDAQQIREWLHYVCNA